MTEFDFGRYKGKAYDEVYAENPRYMQWVHSQEIITQSNPTLKEFLDQKFKNSDGSYLLTFGKYKHKTIRQVLAIDRQYLEWLMTSPFFEKMTKLRADLAKIL